MEKVVFPGQEDTDYHNLNKVFLQHWHIRQCFLCDWKKNTYKTEELLIVYMRL